MLMWYNLKSILSSKCLPSTEMLKYQDMKDYITCLQILLNEGNIIEMCTDFYVYTCTSKLEFSLPGIKCEQ